MKRTPCWTIRGSRSWPGTTGYCSSSGALRAAPHPVLHLMSCRRLSTPSPAPPSTSGIRRSRCPSRGCSRSWATGWRHCRRCAYSIRRVIPTLYVRPRADISQNYRLMLLVVGYDNFLREVDSGNPTQLWHPTSQWSVGELIRIRYPPLTYHPGARLGIRVQTTGTGAAEGTPARDPCHRAAARPGPGRSARRRCRERRISRTAGAERMPWTHKRSAIPPASQAGSLADLDLGMLGVVPGEAVHLFDPVVTEEVRENARRTAPPPWRTVA